MSVIKKAMGKVGRSEPRERKKKENVSPESNQGHENTVWHDAWNVNASDAIDYAIVKEPPAAAQSPHDTHTAPRCNNLRNIDWARLRGFGVLGPDSNDERLLEEYRRIKRPILENAFSSATVPNGNLILVTSPLPGDGKTVTALNLAVVMAMGKDTSVLLIDGDCQKGELSQRLGVEREPGLKNLIMDRSIGTADVIINTDVPRLSVIPVGTNDDFSVEHYGSKKMLAFVEEFGQRYPDRLVLFDSAPLLARSETTVTARFTGQVVFVIASGQTTQSAILSALDMLDGTKPIGMILNKCAWSSGRHYKGYYGY